MSADNYLHADIHEDKFYVWMEFASDDEAPHNVEWVLRATNSYSVFDTIEEMETYLDSYDGILEYGISYSHALSTWIETERVTVPRSELEKLFNRWRTGLGRAICSAEYLHPNSQADAMQQATDEIYRVASVLGLDLTPEEVSSV